jgi:MFS family permease
VPQAPSRYAFSGEREMNDTIDVRRPVRRAADGSAATLGSPAIVALTGLTALAISMGVARFAFTPILPMMQQDAGLSVSEGGWLATANYLGFLFGALSAMVVRVQPALGMRWGLLAICAVTVAMAFERRFVGWVAFRAVAGFAGAWVQVLAFSWSLERLAALRSPFWNGVFFSGVGVGMAAAGLYCLVLMQLNGSFGSAWIGLGLMSLVATRMIWGILRPAADGFTADTGRPSFPAGSRRNADALLVILCFGASGFGYIIPATFLPVMARELVADPLVFGWAWPIFGAATALAPMMAAQWLETLGNRRLWMASHLIMAAGVAMLVWWPSISGITTAALFVGSTFMVNAKASMQEARAVGGQNAPTLIAATVASFATGQIAGPVCVSSLVGNDGRFAEALLAAALVLVASAAALAFRSR